MFYDMSKMHAYPLTGVVAPRLRLLSTQKQGDWGWSGAILFLFAEQLEPWSIYSWWRTGIFLTCFGERVKLTHPLSNKIFEGHGT